MLQMRPGLSYESLFLLKKIYDELDRTNFTLKEVDEEFNCSTEFQKSRDGTPTGIHFHFEERHFQHLMKLGLICPNGEGFGHQLTAQGESRAEQLTLSEIDDLELEEIALENDFN